MTTEKSDSLAYTEDEAGSLQGAYDEAVAVARSLALRGVWAPEYDELLAAIRHLIAAGATPENGG